MLINNPRFLLRGTRYAHALIVCILSCAVFAFTCAQAVAADAPQVKLAKEPKKFVYNAKGKRNPFTPLLSDDGRFINLEPPERKNELIIEGIIYDLHGLSCAMVNGAVVKVGDTIDTYQVLRIEKEKVVFIKDGQAQEILLKKEE